VLTAIAILLATAGAIEGLLRLVDFRDLRDGYGRGYPSVFRHDAELGWFPVPNAVGPFQGSRTFNVANNSLGLRDVELEATLRPTVLFVGDAFLWGYDVEVQDRFTELLRKDLPGLNIVNAGIPGYGTTQEYLLLQRLWDVLKPDVVVLVVCAGNDRDDNSSNAISGPISRRRPTGAGASPASRCRGRVMPISATIRWSGTRGWPVLRSLPSSSCAIHWSRSPIPPIA
jgi:hypothetical protein